MNRGIETAGFADLMAPETEFVFASAACIETPSATINRAVTKKTNQKVPRRKAMLIILRLHGSPLAMVERRLTRLSKSNGCLQSSVSELLRPWQDKSSPLIGQHILSGHS